MSSSAARVRNRRLGAVAIFGALALAVAGCSAANAGGGDGGGTIKLGVMGDATSPINPYSGIPKVIELAVKQVNDEGGIGGVPVEIVECDLQGVADQATRCSRELVAAGVTGILAQVSVGVEKVPSVLEPANTAYFPAYAFGGVDYTSDVSFPVMPGVLSQMGGAYAAGLEGCERPVLTTIESPTANQMETFAEIGLAAAGSDAEMRYVFAPAGTTDWAPTAAEVVAGNPDCILIYGSEVINRTMFPAIEQTGWKDRSPDNKLVGYQGGVYTQNLLKEFPELTEGLVAVDLSQPFTDEIWGDFNAMIAELEDDQLTNLTSSFTKHSYINFLTWVGAVEQVQEAGDDVTAANVLKILQTSEGIDNGGFTAPFSTLNATPILDWKRLFNTSVVIEDVVDAVPVARNDGEFVNIGPELAEAAQN